MHLQALVAARPQVRLVLRPTSLASQVIQSLTKMTAHLQPSTFRCDVMTATIYRGIPGPDLWMVLDSDTPHNMPAIWIINRLLTDASLLGAFEIEARMGRGYTGLTSYLWASHNPEG